MAVTCAPIAHPCPHSLQWGWYTSILQMRKRRATVSWKLDTGLVILSTWFFTPKILCYTRNAPVSAPAGTGWIPAHLLVCPLSFQMWHHFLGPSQHHLPQHIFPSPRVNTFFLKSSGSQHLPLPRHPFLWWASLRWTMRPPTLSSTQFCCRGPD